MIAVTFVQHRGKPIAEVVRVSMAVAPVLGESVTVTNHKHQPIVEGRVEKVDHRVIMAEGLGTSFSEIVVTLAGWKCGFGKD